MEKMNNKINDDSVQKLTLFFCQICSHAPFKTKSGRDKHELNIHSFDRYDKQIMKD